MANNFNNSINSTVGSSNSGATNTFTIQNTSNTASSQANAIISVAGATAADPYLTFNISGVSNWSIGADNSASDNFVVSNSTALGTTNILSASSSLFDVTTPSFRTVNSLSGSSVVSEVNNSSNTASSDAFLLSTVQSGSAGDPYIRFNIEAVQQWCLGIDNSDSDAFVVSAATNPGTSNVMRSSASGQITYPSQPTFLAAKSAQTNNVTGNGTVYSFVSDTEIFDVGSNYNNSTGIFTAPVTAKYVLTCNTTLVGCTIASNLGNYLTTSNRTYRANNIRAASSNTFPLAFTQVCDMDAADTCTFQVSSFGEAADTDDLYGDGLTSGTWVSGWQLG